MKDRGKQLDKRYKHKRGLRVLVWTLAFFVCCQFLLSPVFDYLLPAYRFPWFYRLIEQADRLPSSETILCLGSSRFGTGLFAGEMTPLLRQATGDEQVVVINAGLPAGDYITSERMLNELLARGIRPKLLLLEFCPDVLNHKMGWLNFHSTRTLCWHDLKDFGPDLSNWHAIQRFAMCRLFPLVQYRNSIRTRLNDRWLAGFTASPDGSPSDVMLQLTDHHWTVELEQPAGPMPKQLRELASHFENYQIGGQPVASLRRLLKRCQHEQIQVILIEPPVAEIHRQHYTAEIERQYQRFYQELCAEFTLTRYSYRDAIPDEQFYDHHHCSRSGAHRWSEKVTQDVLIPQWAWLAGLTR